MCALFCETVCDTSGYREIISESTHFTVADKHTDKKKHEDHISSTIGRVDFIEMCMFLQNCGNLSTEVTHSGHSPPKSVTLS